ncbi:MAG TPA: hypothetical protein VJX94_28275 [Stellaceae bacterium]|nr:hypothetical protein [Stellaceae bacterium]
MTEVRPKGVSLNLERQQLLRRRSEALARLLRQGDVLLIARLDAALAALEEAPAEWEPASRAVVSDDGQAVRLTLYAEIGAIAAMDLDPIRAIGLAGKLIDGAAEAMWS